MERGMRSLFIPVLLDGGREGGMKVGETGERRSKEGRKEGEKERWRQGEGRREREMRLLSIRPSPS